jgi:hypothetical protein
MKSGQARQKKIEKHAGKEMEEKEKHITRLFQI